MATPTASVRDYCTLLGKSKLLPADEVESLHRRWRDETQGSDDQVEAFGKFLVGKRVLTPYQAAMVQRGRADGFFLSGYKILDRIGKGQMGGVYKAVHTLGQLVALKILPASRAKNAHVLGRFQREARLLTQLDHPNVVRAFQVGEANGVHYIVMEYLEGETLDDVLTRRKKLPVPEAARLVHQVYTGLQHLHERRMVHRDMKPSNLMITPGFAPGKPDTTWDATVKILDVGLGRELFDENTPEGQIETQLTVEGTVLGTPDYLAPEQAKDARSADIRADIYSVGCTLYQLVTGRTPFPDTNIMTQMLRHATESPTPVAAFAPDAPPGFQQALDVLMAKDPARRPQTPAEAAAIVERFLTPNAGARPAGADMVPAFKQWLETESAMELKAVLPPAPGPAVKAGTANLPPLPQTARPGTAPTPALPAVPVAAAVPVAKPAPPPVRTAIPVPAKTAPAARPAAPAPLSLDDDEEVEVELVTAPAAGAAPAFAPPPEPVVIEVPEDRPLWELNRRDLFMLGAGGMGVLAAVGLGYGLAQLVKRKPTEKEE